MRYLLTFLILALTAHPCHGWSACGHHMIALLGNVLPPQAVEPLVQQPQLGLQSRTVRGLAGSTDQTGDPRLNFACIDSHATIRSYHHRVDGGMPEKLFEQHLCSGIAGVTSTLT